MTTPFAFDWVHHAAQHRPETPALGSPEGWLSYAALDKRVRALAAVLRAQGLQAGERVLIALPNGPAPVVASLAAQALGAAAVEVHRDAGSSSLAAILQQCRPRHLFMLGRDTALWQPLLAQSPVEHLHVVHPSALPERMQSLLGPLAQHFSEDGLTQAQGALDSPERWQRKEEACALLVYTSGSTGVPRAVIQSHRNIAVNTAAIVRYLSLSAEDRAMAILPLAYCYGKSVLHSHLAVGASVFFDPRFVYPQVVMTAMQEQGCTGFAGVPLTFELLRRQVQPRAFALPKLRYLTQAGGRMEASTEEWVREQFQPTQLFVMYGQTEATARLSYLPPDKALAKKGSVGVAVEGVRLKIVDEAGKDCPEGEVGQLVAQGESITQGYFQAPEESAELLKGGWLWTGDLASMDAEGFVFLKGRAKEMLKVGGHRVSAQELEQGLLDHPDVLEVAVIGRDDAVEGEVAEAFVVLKPGSPLDEQTLKKHCRERLPAYKVPRGITFLTALPRSPAGKVLKASLKPGELT